MRVRLRDGQDLVTALAAGDGTFDDEPVDLLQHALQCAALLERRAPGDLELHVAGLVHDVGTLIAPGRAEHHAEIGAAAIRGMLGSRVARLVRLHDQAKRYLVTTDPHYRHQLSSRSLETLRLQGGLLDPAERAALQAEPDLDACLALRRADDAAKVPGVSVAGLTHWRQVLVTLARSAA
jgi:predicted HD phosphohydrolase